MHLKPHASQVEADAFRHATTVSAALGPPEEPVFTAMTVDVHPQAPTPRMVPRPRTSAADYGRTSHQTSEYPKGRNWLW